MVSYTIQYRQQNLAGTGYDVVTADTVSGSAKMGTIVTAELKNYDGFTPVINEAQQMRLGTGAQHIDC